MDRTSVEQAFAFTAPEEHAPGTLGFTWNAEGSEVMIDPSNDFPYGATVTWNVLTEARDLSGNLLLEAGSGQFSVIRLVSTTIQARGDYGTLVGPPVISMVGGLIAGEYNVSSPSATRVFLNFSLAAVPLEVTRITSANLTWTTGASLGSPFYYLGDLLIESVDYGAQLESVARDFDAPARGEPIVVQGESYPQGNSERFRIPVTPLVAADLANRSSQADRSQFRLRFELENNQDPTTSRLVINNDSFFPTLELSYEQP